MGRELELGIRITADGRAVVQESSKAAKALEGIGQAADRTAGASERLNGAIQRAGHYM